MNSIAISIVFILSASSGYMWTIILWLRQLLVVELHRYVLIHFIPENALSLEVFVAGITRKNLTTFSEICSYQMLRKPLLVCQLNNWAYLETNYQATAAGSVIW